MKKTSLNKILCACCLLAILGCSDYLEVETPKDHIDKTKVFSDDQLATAALTQVYSLMRANGFLSGTTSGAGVLLGCYTDELEATTTRTVAFRNFYEGSVLSNNSGISELWNQSYKQIYMANTMIEGLTATNALTENIRRQLLGEAYTVRALIHLYLCQTFADVPYVTTTDYKINQKITKLKARQVLENVVEDLIEAEKLLVPAYPSAEKVRINQAAAQAFLARAYLYLENWDKAAYYAQLVIENSAYDLDELDKVFLKTGKSAIWQFKPEFEGKNALEADSYIFESVPAPDVKIALDLLNAFEPDDNRKVEWLKGVGTGEVNSHAYKYRLRGGSLGGSSTEYSTIIRIEEMYLIAAEAAAEQQNWDVCNDMINKIRSRVGLAEVSVANREEAVSTILQERRVELFCEYGHRFYDLKRKGRLNAVTLNKSGWQPHFSVLPLPENELLLNPNLLPQNIGY